MKRTKVKSSYITSIGHDADSNTLHVKFKSGKLFEYDDVTADEFNKLLWADSIGAHFSKHIRKRKDFREV